MLFIIISDGIQVESIYHLTILIFVIQRGLLFHISFSRFAICKMMIIRDTIARMAIVNWQHNYILIFYSKNPTKEIEHFWEAF